MLNSIATNAELVIDGLLGQGSMGCVYSAYHRGLKKSVAVKVMSASMTENPVARAYFSREGRLMARVHSEHVVRLLEHKGETENPYLVMEKVEGENLAQWLRNHDWLLTDDITDIVHQISLGLEAIHEAGVVHGDVKAENVIVENCRGTPVARLIDFGVSRAMNDDDIEKLEADSSPGGTPACMPPEQLLHSESSQMSWDVWALAVLSYRLLVGKSPFDGDIQSNLGPEVDAVFRRAFSLDPAKRYPSALEFSRALTQTVSASAELGQRIVVAQAGSTVSTRGNEDPQEWSVDDLFSTTVPVVRHVAA